MMHADILRRIDYLVTRLFCADLYEGERDGIMKALKHNRELLQREKLERQLANLEYEVRRETGADRDATAKARDAVLRELEKLQ